MSNTGNIQQIIDYGATANDGQGDPLRTAFIKTDENFSNIWAAGPVGSNITIANNTIQNDSTNGNIVIKPNGIGIVQSNAHVLPNTTDVRNLGSTDLRWRTLYLGIGGIDSTGDITTGSLTVSGNATVQGNLVVEGDIVELGNIITDRLTIQLANTAANAAQANGAGITVGANDDIATILYNPTTNAWQFNIAIDAPDASFQNLQSPNVVVNNISSDDSTVVTIKDGINIEGDAKVQGDITADYNLQAEFLVTIVPKELANLTAVVGGRAFASDANLSALGNFGAQVSGGGANTVPVWSDGVNWYIG